MTTTLTEPTTTGQSATTQGGDTSGTTTNGTTASGSTTTSWRDTLPEELKNDMKLSQFKDVGDLAKAYQHAHSLIGKKGVIVPGEKASDQEWEHFFKSVGRPDLDKYEVAAPKDKKVNPELVAKFKEAAHKTGLLPKQAQKVLEFYVEQEHEASVQAAAMTAKQRTEGVEALKKEWGQGWDKNVSLAKLAVKEVGGDEFAKYLEETGLGDDTRLIQVMAKVGALLGEDKIRGEGGTKFGKTPAEAKREITDILGNFNHPYYDTNHPSHRAAVAQVEELFKMSAQ